MRRPLTLSEATDRGLLAPDGQDVHTFSNGSHWDSWACGNCHACRWYDQDVLGDLCAFEGAAFLKQVSPELAQMFGWPRDEEAAKKYGERSAYDPPETCAFFWDGKNDRGEDVDAPPSPDPNQLVLIADPTEDAATIQNTRCEEAAMVQT